MGVFHYDPTPKALSRKGRGGMQSRLELSMGAFGRRSGRVSAQVQYPSFACH